VLVYEERVEVLRRGAGNGALLQFVPLQESEEESGEVPGLSAVTIQVLGLKK